MRRAFSLFHPAATAFGAAILAVGLTAAPLRAETAEEMQTLFSELAETGGEGWMRAESDILRIWSRSGSAALDLLLIRGEAALDAGDTAAAIGHLTALTDHAPDFAAGWTARATAFALAGQAGPAAADLSRALQLEPRDWNALTLLGALLEESGDTARALAAYQASLKINPHQQDTADAVTRLTTADLGQDA